MWKQEEEITGASCKVNWATVCTPTTHGGLGILDLERFSRALRLRWLWIAWTDPGRLCVGTAPPCCDQDLALFAAATTVTIGDGSTALFWHSRWIGPCTLAAAYLGLYNHSKQKRRTVQEAIRDDNWIKDLRHGDMHPLLPEFIRLNRQIIAAATVFSEGTRDTIRWNQEARGQYTTRSAYAMQFQGRLRSDTGDLIWKTWAPGNIKFFTWLLLKDRLWTNDRLQRRGWPNSYFCQLCVRSWNRCTTCSGAAPPLWLSGARWEAKETAQASFQVTHGRPRLRFRLCRSWLKRHRQFSERGQKPSSS